MVATHSGNKGNFSLNSEKIRAVMIFSENFKKLKKKTKSKEVFPKSRIRFG